MANFNGSPGDDIFTGGADADTAVGNGGNDTLSGGDNNDILVGNAGSDTLNGGDGDDWLFSHDRDVSFGGFLGRGISLDIFTEVDTLVGGAGDDYIFAGIGDNVDGGTVGSYGNRLFISFMGATSGVQADFRPLQTQTSIVIAGGTISNIQNIGYLEGSNFDDLLVPIDTYYPTGANVYGRGGNDQIIASYYSGWGGSGLYGGDGDDIVDGRTAQYGPALYGDAGNDTLYSNSNSFTVAYGGDGNDTIYSHGTTYGGNGNDLIVLQDTYYKGLVYGEAGDDDIRASSGGNSISGGGGADVLTGAAGNDILASGDFVANSSTAVDDMGLEHDVLTGFGGNDTLAAGYGDDVDGGSGTDILRLSLGGAASGVAFDTAGIVAGTPFVFAGGTINSIETLAYLRGSEFADTLNLATQGQLLTVDAGNGDDVITSNNSSVSVAGGNGNDRFISGAAGDTFDGGAGIDTIDYRNATAGVTVSLGLAAGQTGTGPGGDSLVNVENIDGSALGDTLNGSNDANFIQGMAGIDTLNGNGGNDTLSGGDGDDMLNGGAGNDVLSGDGGADRMAGGANNDIYFVNDAGDQVVEAANEGNDIVYTSLSYALAADAQVETLSASDNSATIALNLTGNGFANSIWGNNGANVLNGGGGADIMLGFGGDDIFFVDNGGDLIAAEGAGGGNDIVYATASFALAADAQVETLSAADNSATIALSLSGNGFANSVYGNNGANALNGGGGADIMLGFGGDDIFFVDHANDLIAAEGAGGGNDTVYASVNYTLSADAQVETLSAINNSFTTALDLTGNGFANNIWGNNGANTLNGGGGADIMLGFGGNDIFFVDNINDLIAAEGAGGGNDIVYAGTSYALSAGAQIETLSASDNSLTISLDLTGNGFANSVWGNNGANTLNGGGGADILLGFGGADTFAFTTALGGGNVDLVAGFVSGQDKIALDDAVFTGLGLGTLSAGAFALGTAAGDADDRILYDSATGNLYFDADGNASGSAAVLFANLDAHPIIAASDFTVI